MFCDPLFNERKAIIVNRKISSHSLPAGSAWELSKPNKEAESLVTSILKLVASILKLWGFELFWCDVTTGRRQGICDDITRTWETISSGNLLILFFQNKLGENPCFRVLNWPSSVRGPQVMAKKR